MKITKKQIHKILTSGNVTQVHYLLHKLGINVDNKTNVFNFIRDNAKTQKVSQRAYSLSYGRQYNKQIKNNLITERKGVKNVYFREPITSAIRFAKQQKKDGGWGNYGKILFEGNRHIYWCHAGYGHEDYNKSIAFDNTEKNRKLANIINKYLGYTTNL